MRNRVKELCDHYSQLDEKGKEEMTTLLENYSLIERGKKMTEQEINSWAILIAVIKNSNKKYDHIDNLIDDISEIKELIKLLK
jgi:hypothetical protein